MTLPAAHNPDPEIVQSLKKLGLIDNDATARFEMLTGGVSSDIWKVVSGDRVYCVKRAPRSEFPWG